VAQELRVTYLANEGVLVESGGTRVLIDALFRDSLDPYARHSPAWRTQTGRSASTASPSLAFHLH
jgi:L-ascorbate metabolism protein UlaG (beta-lactamase superfamily)